MITKSFLIVCGMLVVSLFATPSGPPNILLIMADDLGIECLGAYGGESYETPRLDALAASGHKYLNCHATPKCSPSRVTLLTGRYTFRTTRKWGHIPREEITFGQILKNAGYATALAGKWQLGRIKDTPKIVPHFGFDAWCVWAWHEGPRYWQPTIWEDGRIRDDVSERYGPDVYTDYLIKFMETHREGPFLAYYPMCLTHFPKGPEPAGPSGKKESFAEMVAQMDRAVGRLVDALDRLKLREDTLILFTADNGSPTNVTSLRKGKKVKGGKASLKDSGTHVPLIASWPGRIAPAKPEILIDFSDFLPTLTELGRGRLPEEPTIDGQSFAWSMLGRKGVPRDWIFTEWSGHHWIRDQRYKLYDDGMLFDLREDPDERNAMSPYSDDAELARYRAWLGSKLALLLDGAKEK